MPEETNEHLLNKMNQALEKLVLVAEYQSNFTTKHLTSQNATTKAVDDVQSAIYQGNAAQMSPLAKIPLLYGAVKSIHGAFREAIARNDKLQKEALGRGSNLTKVMKKSSQDIEKFSANLTGYQNVLENRFESWSAGLRHNSEAVSKLGIYTRVTGQNSKSLFTNLAKNTAGLGYTEEQLGSLADTTMAVSQKYGIQTSQLMSSLGELTAELNQYAALNIGAAMQEASVRLGAALGPAMAQMGPELLAALTEGSNMVKVSLLGGMEARTRLLRQEGNMIDNAFDLALTVGKNAEEAINNWTKASYDPAFALAQATKIYGKEALLAIRVRKQLQEQARANNMSLEAYIAQVKVQSKVSEEFKASWENFKSRVLSPFQRVFTWFLEKLTPLLEMPLIAELTSVLIGALGILGLLATIGSGMISQMIRLTTALKAQTASGFNLIRAKGMTGETGSRVDQALNRMIHGKERGAQWPQNRTKFVQRDNTFQNSLRGGKGRPFIGPMIDQRKEGRYNLDWKEVGTSINLEAKKRSKVVAKFAKSRWTWLKGGFRDLTGMLNTKLTLLTGGVSSLFSTVSNKSFWSGLLTKQGRGAAAQGVGTGIGALLSNLLWFLPGKLRGAKAMRGAARVPLRGAGATLPGQLRAGVTYGRGARTGAAITRMFPRLMTALARLAPAAGAGGGTAAGVLSGPVGWILLFVSLFTDFGKLFKDVLDAMKQMGGWIKYNFGESIQGIKDAWKQLDRAFEPFKPAFGKLTEVVTALVGWIIKLPLYAVAFVIIALIKVLGWVIQGVTYLATGLVWAVRGIFMIPKLIVGAFMGVVTWLIDSLKTVMSPIVAAVMWLYDGIMYLLDGIETIITAVLNLPAFIKIKIMEFGSWIVEGIGAVFSPLTWAVRKLYNAITWLGSKIWGGIKWLGNLLWSPFQWFIDTWRSIMPSWLGGGGGDDPTSLGSGRVTEDAALGIDPTSRPRGGPVPGSAEADIEMGLVRDSWSPVFESKKRQNEMISALEHQLERGTRADGIALSQNMRNRREGNLNHLEVLQAQEIRHWDHSRREKGGSVGAGTIPEQKMALEDLRSKGPREQSDISRRLHEDRLWLLEGLLKKSEERQGETNVLLQETVDQGNAGLEQRAEIQRNSKVRPTAAKGGDK